VTACCASAKTVGSPVGQSGRSGREGVDGLLSKKYRVAGGFGELLDVGRDVDGVTDEGELESAGAADGAGRAAHRSGRRPAGPDPAALKGVRSIDVWPTAHRYTLRPHRRPGKTMMQRSSGTATKVTAAA
jgi:hypothetical protein